MSATNAGNTYPKSTAVMKRWMTEVKENPHHTKHAGVFSPEACRYVLGEYPLTEAVDFQHRCVFVMCVCGAMRMEDIVRAPKMLKSAELDIPRSVCFVLRKTKNDPRGDGPVEGRTWRVPCCCLASLDAADSKRMKADLKKNPQVPCYGPCPYQVIIDYTLRIPDPFGHSWKSAMAVDPQRPSLKFMRARLTTGDRPFTTMPLGINMLRKFLSNANLRLPEHLSLLYSPNTSGNSGRRSFVKNAVNSAWGGCSERR